MSEEVPTTPAVSTEETKKKKFYRNPKLAAVAVTGVIAAAAALFIRGSRGNDSDPVSTPETDEVTETFTP